MPKTVLITGATSGIGLGLAQAYLARGATVIATGRDRDKLARVAAANPGLFTVVMDVSDLNSIKDAIAHVLQAHPALDVVINNAGVQTLADFATTVPSPAQIAAEIDTNLTGLIAVSAAVIPHLKTRPRAQLVQVGSGLGYVPLDQAPVYSATKAAVHAFSRVLRRQLANTSVAVTLLVPPVVATDLHRHQGRRPPRAMPLDVFVAAAMTAIDRGSAEAPIGLAKVLRTGSRLLPGLFQKIINGRPSHSEAKR